MPSNFRLRLKFWGVRGSTPTPQLENLCYGGNTSCLEVRLPDNEVFIFDGGSGIRALGDRLLEELQDQKLNLRLFLTHFHWDHIEGIPFFKPLYNPSNEITFCSFHSCQGLEKTLKGSMTGPYFPVSFEFLPARLTFMELDRKPIQDNSLSIHPFPLNHPQGARGYRLESQGAVIVYATDHEHGDKKIDAVLRDHAQGADVLIYDAQFTPSEYERHRGWGHSTWLEATQVARDAQVGQLILFHHHPGHSDTAVFQIVQQARLQFENTIAAQEGSLVVL